MPPAPHLLTRCRACFLHRHDDCDPAGEWCECPCGTGEVLDPYRIPEEDP